MPERLLIIDDDPHFVEVLARGLRRREYPVEVATDAATALACARTFKPQWIALDLRLGDDSGLQLIQPLLAQVPSARIVMLTGYASIATAVEAVKQGAHNYLHKPATIHELLRAFGDSDPHDTMEDEPGEVMSVDRMEWEHIQRVLNEHEGNISATARALNMHRRTLQRKLQKYAPR
ncbi:two-component system response regulator [Bacterioplanes sanyensis]|uniref:Two-component system response regulator n=1 Tax=Bacterioplanes sanyensis TaxID=1249553 RepID=A0A222FE08_9GAMM|nr:response regulator transcription factor [Bacterioplanes sanyensis]ASP37327.1 two-component system response regulator [Bacterioplanes sanyensis]